MKHLFGDHFPIGTLLVNLIGCFLLGLLNEWFDEIGNRDLRLILGVGFLGALTTFSTFGVETFSKFQQGQPLLALTNVAANLLLGLAMAAAGFYVGKWLGGSHSMI
jgi:CrcB protein